MVHHGYDTRAGPGRHGHTGGMSTRTWNEIVAADPEHSGRYARRWDDMVAQGRDIDGEARLVDAMVPRGARILDAGCGQGRTGAYLAARGHRVTGVDLDPHLVAVARERTPDAHWEVSDLAADGWAPGPFDLVVSAGNVLAFVAPEDRRTVLAHLADRLVPGDLRGVDGGGDTRPGRLVVGFGLDRGWPLDAFREDAAAAGLDLLQVFSGWELWPREAGAADDEGFLVAVLVRSRTAA